MLSKQIILKSVEVLTQANAINVLWENQILEDDVVISATNYRCAYGKGQKEQFEADLGDEAVKYVGLIDWTPDVSVS